jgi:hypothetical protein
MDIVTLPCLGPVITRDFARKPPVFNGSNFGEGYTHSNALFRLDLKLLQDISAQFSVQSYAEPCVIIRSEDASDCLPHSQPHIQIQPQWNKVCKDRSQEL